MDMNYIKGGLKVIMKRKQYYAIDFDGTIVEHEFPRIGRPIESTVRLMHKLREQGHCIIIWTCRSGRYLASAVKFLKDNGIPFDYVNENPEVDFGSPKIFANVYLDDRNIGIHEVDLHIEQEFE